MNDFESPIHPDLVLNTYCLNFNCESCQTSLLSSTSLKLPSRHLSSLDLLLKLLLQGHRIRSKLRDALAQLLRSHGVLVEVEAELGLILDVGALRYIQFCGVSRVQLLRHWVGRVIQLLQEVRLIR